MEVYFSLFIHMSDSYTIHGKKVYCDDAHVREFLRQEDDFAKDLFEQAKERKKSGVIFKDDWRRDFTMEYKDYGFYIEEGADRHDRWL